MSTTLKLSDFSPELLHHVFRFCSQCDLISLSCVNSTFRPVAEYLLYQHIRVSFKHKESWPSQWMKTSFFCTLASNPQKVALLRSLHVYSNPDGTGDNENFTLLTEIIKVLRNANCLVDLCVMIRCPGLPKKVLSEIIKNNHFQLHTLYCDPSQDLEGIMASQKDLRLLGIYDTCTRDYLHLLKLVKRKCHKQINSNENNPAIFVLTCWRHSSKNVQLTFFPESYLPGQAFALCRDITTPVGRFIGQHLHHGHDVAPIDHTIALAIHVFDFSDEKAATICEVIEAMAQCFADCQIFTIWLQTSAGKRTILNPWRIAGFPAAIGQFKRLRCLNFWVSCNDSLYQAVNDMCSFLSEEFCLDDQTMVHLRRDDNTVYAELSRDPEWHLEFVDPESGSYYMDTSWIG